MYDSRVPGGVRAPTFNFMTASEGQPQAEGMSPEVVAWISGIKTADSTHRMVGMTLARVRGCRYRYRFAASRVRGHTGWNDVA